MPSNDIMLYAPLEMEYEIRTPLVLFKRLHPGAILPVRATAGAACYDLYADEPIQLTSYRPSVVVGTGIAVQLPPGYAGLVCSRSGLAAKNRVFVVNAPGVIDEDYRGEIKVILGWIPNNYEWPSMTDLELPAGSRIAQLMIVPVAQLQVVEVEEFTTTTDRGEGGLGSTGL